MSIACLSRRTVVIPPPSEGLNRYESIQNALVGAGRFAAGADMSALGVPTNTVTVTNTNDSGTGSLRTAAQTEGAYIQFDPSLDGQVITVNTAIQVQERITIDGRDAQVTVSPSTSKPRGSTVRFVGGETIVVKLCVDGQGDQNKNHGVNVAHGENYVFLGMDVDGFDTDDGVNVGDNNNPTISARDITFGFCRFDGSKGLLIDQDERPVHDNNRVGMVSVYRSLFEARDRNPRMNGGKMHMWDSVIRDWLYGSNVVVNDGEDPDNGKVGSEVLAWTYAQGCHYRNAPQETGNKAYGERVDESGPKFTPHVDPACEFYREDSTYFGIVNQGALEHVYDLSSNPGKRPSIPYPYDRIDKDDVYVTVIAEAGKNFQLPFEV